LIIDYWNRQTEARTSQDSNRQKVWKKDFSRSLG